MGVLNPSWSTVAAAESRLSLRLASTLTGINMAVEGEVPVGVKYTLLEGVPVDGVIGVEKYSWSVLVALLTPLLVALLRLIAVGVTLMILVPLELEIGDNNWYSMSSCLIWKKSETPACGEDIKMEEDADFGVRGMAAEWPARGIILPGFGL